MTAYESWVLALKSECHHCCPLVNSPRWGYSIKCYRSFLDQQIKFHQASVIKAFNVLLRSTVGRQTHSLSVNVAKLLLASLWRARLLLLEVDLLISFHD